MTTNIYLFHNLSPTSYFKGEFQPYIIACYLWRSVNCRSYVVIYKCTYFSKTHLIFWWKGKSTQRHERKQIAVTLLFVSHSQTCCPCGHTPISDVIVGVFHLTADDKHLLQHHCVILIIFTLYVKDFLIFLDTLTTSRGQASVCCF